MLSSTPEHGQNTMKLEENKKIRQTVSELRQPTKFGVCLWWPDESLSWIHPEDIEIAERLVPGDRIFKRQECPNYADRELGYSLISYGGDRFRALPAIWLPIQFEGFEIGDFVEIKSRLGRRRAAIGTIKEIRWNRLGQRIAYYVDANTIQSSSPLHAGDLQPAIRLNGFLSERELRLSCTTDQPRARFKPEPNSLASA